MSRTPTNKTSTTQSLSISTSNSNYYFNPDSQCSTSLADPSDFSPSEFISSSMSLLDNTDQDNIVDIDSIGNDINFVHTNTDIDTTPLINSDTLNNNGNGTALVNYLNNQVLALTALKRTKKLLT
ncbi:hypothetical protein DPMN_087823 [Dreissena polymorpha]|uniref:Uncharacterized protein n=1 Tax=Dreissena polymorpha TaxID=45954 RepID=A0A9D4KT11_DREPO|nr:hypothetical protein DPMN_087823 [Dreissena polymorpha]